MSLKLEINIADDRDLRESIRDAIKGEVTSVMRGEIRNVLKEVVSERGGKSFTTEGLEQILVDEIKIEIRKQIKELVEVKRYGEPSYLQKEISRIAEEMLRETFSK